jgi:hypothetical protein
MRYIMLNKLTIKNLTYNYVVYEKISNFAVQ